ncbi:MAG: hypothetical protein ACK4NR_11995 [Micavibrio sp.]
MSVAKTVSYLRLISDNTQSFNSGHEHFIKDCVLKQPEQLALPYLDPFTLLLVNVEGMQVDNFSNLLQSFEPRWVIDARATPRMDVLGGTRSYAFNLFQTYNVQYVDLFGHLGLSTYRTVESNPIFFGDVISETFKKFKAVTGPFVMLFDNLDLMEQSRNVLPTPLTNFLGRDVSLTIYQ